MIGVNPPGNFLWYPRTTDEQIRQVRRPLRRGRSVQQADGRPRRDACGDGRAHPRPLVVPADQAGQRPRRVVLRPDERDVGGRADLGADDDRLVALGRATATRAGSGSCRCWPSSSSPTCRSRATSRPSAGPTRPPRRATSRRHGDGGSILGNPGTDFLWAGGRLRGRLAGRPRRQRLRPCADVAGRRRS